MTCMAAPHDLAPPPGARTSERAMLPTSTAWAAAVLGCAGVAIVVWEVASGPTVTPDGMVQDHGGYLVGVPLLLAAVTAALTLVVGSRSRDSTTTSVLRGLAVLAVCAPLIAIAGAAASGVLTFEGLDLG